MLNYASSQPFVIRTGVEINTMWLNGLFDLWQNLKSYHFIIHMKWRNIATPWRMWPVWLEQLAPSVYVFSIGTSTVAIEQLSSYMEQILRISCSILLLSNCMFDTDTTSSWRHLLVHFSGTWVYYQRFYNWPRHTSPSVYHCVFQQLFCRLTCKHEPSYTHVHPSYIIHWSCATEQTKKSNTKF